MTTAHQIVVSAETIRISRGMQALPLFMYNAHESPAVAIVHDSGEDCYPDF